ncbi:MAG: hypothetical protein EB127_30340 [Alphaproteobacteria bacterium]|nr:hypothetical protein [Alphaproteobacteria bacterium]
MIVTVADNITASVDSFNEARYATAFLKKFQQVVGKVLVSGEAGLAVAYFILNRVSSVKDYTPPDIEVSPDSTEEYKKKVLKIQQEINKVVNRKY